MTAPSSAPPPAVTTPSAVVSTPTVRAAAKRHLFWILAVVFLLLIAVVTLVIRGAGSPEGEALSPSNPAPAGAMAVAEVLKQHGVNVVPAETLRAAEKALTADGDSTLLVFDPDSRLNATQLRQLEEITDNLVLVTPSFSQLRALTLQIGQAGAAKSSIRAAKCTTARAARAGTITGHSIRGAANRAGVISGGGNVYRVLDKDAVTTACFPSGKDSYSLVTLRGDIRQLTVLGAEQVLANETVAQNGNAALALNLLGSTRTLVWYLPSIDDVAVTGLPTIAELTPPWVSSVALLLICSAIAAAFWRGRRLGPLVIENLPVTVRANETMEGRARLYQKNSARLRALDALRIGTVGRLARLCGLPRSASTTEVIDRVSALTRRERGEIARLLVDAAPADDRELIRLSDALLDLERSVAQLVAG